jgi:hypothetical protein
MVRSFKMSNAMHKGLLRRFLTGRRGQAGGAIVEFALVIPLFLAIVGGILEFSGIMVAQTLLEGGIREASRFGILGSAPTDSTREAALIEIVDKNSFGIIDTSDIRFETLAYGSFGAVGQPEPFEDLNGNGEFDEGEPFVDVNGNDARDDDQGRADAGGADEVVVYRLSYDWDIIIPLFRPFFGDTVAIDAAIAVRNEPFT